MTTPKGLSGTISRQTDSGKIRCLTYEVDVSRMLNVNTGDTYLNYKMHTFTTMSVILTI